MELSSLYGMCVLQIVVGRTNAIAIVSGVLAGICKTFPEVLVNPHLERPAKHVIEASQGQRLTGSS